MIRSFMPAALPPIAFERWCRADGPPAAELVLAAVSAVWLHLGAAYIVFARSAWALGGPRTGGARCAWAVVYTFALRMQAAHLLDSPVLFGRYWLPMLPFALTAAATAGSAPIDPWLVAFAAALPADVASPQ